MHMTLGSVLSLTKLLMGRFDDPSLAAAEPSDAVGALIAHDAALNMIAVIIGLNPIKHPNYQWVKGEGHRHFTPLGIATGEKCISNHLSHNLEGGKS